MFSALSDRCRKRAFTCSIGSAAVSGLKAAMVMSISSSDSTTPDSEAGTSTKTRWSGVRRGGRFAQAVPTSNR